jgi:type II secretion system (T2SS) protein M
VKDSQESSDLNFAINRIAQNHHLKGFSGKVLETARRAKQTPARKIREPRLQLNFTSDFANFIRFVNALERHRPAFFINTFKVERIAKDQTEIKAELEIAAFVNADSVPSPSTSGAQESGERIQ